MCGVKSRFVCGEPLKVGEGAADFDASLEVLAGPIGAGDHLFLGGVMPLVLGKVPESAVVLTGTQVSRRHARLERIDFSPSRWKLIDNRSTNGTFVNGEKIAEIELTDGDRVRLGEFEFKFSLAKPPAVMNVPTTAAGATCRGCAKMIATGAKFCIACGTDQKTGKRHVISRGIDENDLAIRADTWIRGLSFVIPFGLFPVASEAFGTRRPIVTYFITAVTVVASIAFYIAMSGNHPSADVQNLMLWGGRPIDNVSQLEGQDLNAILSALENEDPALGFHWYQLFTHAFLHNGILHLAGNLLFLLVFGMRVNELIGTWKTIVCYTLCILASAGMQLAMTADAPKYPMLGASGAIMGLAGMYFVFFPVQRVHMAIWLRLGLLTGFRLAYKVFPMRGFWLLALWVGINDVLPVALKLPSGTAHWAHLGGFLAGAFLAMVILLTKQVDGFGADLLSRMFKRRIGATTV